MHFPRLDVSSIEGFKKKIQRFNSYISLEFEYASSQSSSSQSYRASQDPPCSDDSPVASIDPVDTPADTVDETCIEPELGCACDLCNDPNCNKNRRIKELEDKIANEQQVQATFFVCLFGLFVMVVLIMIGALMFSCRPGSLDTRTMSVLNKGKDYLKSILLNK